PSAVSYRRASKDPFPSSKYSKAAQIRRTYNGHKNQSSTLRNEEIYGNTANAYGNSIWRDSDDSSTGAEIKYRGMEKLILALVHAARRLQRTDADRPEGKEYTYALRFRFETTNNEAEYEALLVGLQISQEMEITSLVIFVDSQLLVNQIKGTYAAKQPTIKEYLQKTKEALKDFDSYTIEHIRRNQNKKADALSKLASMTFEHLTKEVLVEVLPKRSIEEKEILQVKTKEGESWMTPIHEYLVSGLLPEDPKESKKIRVKAPQYKLIRGNMYRRSFYTIWLRCVASPQTDDIVKEVHEDAAKVLQDYEKCKEQSVIRKVAESSTITTGSGWPFSHWGVNILGPLPTAPGGFKFLEIAIRSATNNQLEGRESFPRRTLLRNSQKETPFSLTYGSEAIIPIFKNDVAKDDRGRIKEVDKRRGSKEIASIEEAHYRSMAESSHDKQSLWRGTLQNCRCIRSLVDSNSKEYKPS
ncbi:reverse transcriptase domain-containing protein, partial [Tanacetum coccineum]